MKLNLKSFALLSFAALALTTGACKKEPALKTTSCTSTWYGFTAPLASMFDTMTTVTNGVINPTTATISSLGSFSSTLYPSQGAYNTTTNNYYAFKVRMGTEVSSGLLYEVSPSGAVTTLTSSSAGYYSSLTYNKVTHKLYCEKNGAIVELTISGSTFSTTSIITPTHPFIYHRTSLTVDNNTGDMYYITGDTAMHYIEKYHAGSSASTVVASTSVPWEIVGMHYNENDNMLYAIFEPRSGSVFNFVKINPAAGTISTVAALSRIVNVDFYSTSIDQCANRYVISSMDYAGGGTSNYLDQISMTGSLLQHNTTATFIQGLDIQ